MPFLGTIINFLCVAVFSLLGAGLKKIIPQRASKAILSAVGVCIIYMGIDGALEPAEGHLTTFFGDAGVTKFIIIVISLVLGTAIGEAINLDKHICSADMYVLHPKVGYFHPIQHYYCGKLIEKVCAPTEKDHNLEWIAIDNIESKMHLQIQSWAVKHYIENHIDK